MNADTEFRLYKAGIREELRHMERTVTEMAGNQDSPLKEAAVGYYEQLKLEYDRLCQIENDTVIESIRDLW